MARPPLLHGSALSPAEYEAYTPCLAAFHADSTAVPSTRDSIWDWLGTTHGSVNPSTASEILALFRLWQPGAEFEPSQLLLAFLRLISHSTSSKVLTRDHIFIQSEPLLLRYPTPTSPGALDATTSKNLFRRQSERSPATATSPLSSPSSPTSSLPTSSSTQASSSPHFISGKSSQSSSNPFRPKTVSAEPAPLNVGGDVTISPPLPPRRREQTVPPPPRPLLRSKSDAHAYAKSLTSYSRAPPPPPPPVRRSSAHFSPPTPIRTFSVISSSSVVPSPIFFSDGQKAPSLQRSALQQGRRTSTAHIGPGTTNLRTSQPAPLELVPNRSGGSIGTQVTGSGGVNKGGDKNDGVEDDGGTLASGLSNSRTSEVERRGIGMEVEIPPPPKRRVTKEGLGDTNPFEEAGEVMLSRQANGSQSLQIIKRASPRAGKVVGGSPLTTVGGVGTATTTASHLLSTTSQRAAKEVKHAFSSGEEWLRGSGGRRIRGTVVTGVGGNEERERLCGLDGEEEVELEEDEGERETERERSELRTEIERDVLREQGGGWDRLEDV